MIRISRRFIILAMTNPALQRHVDELARTLHRVAIIATDVLVPANQGKSRGLMYDGDF